jgi:hypothetical protein
MEGARTGSHALAESLYYDLAYYDLWGKVPGDLTVGRHNENRYRWQGPRVVF